MKTQIIMLTVLTIFIVAVAMFVSGQNVANSYVQGANSYNLEASDIALENEILINESQDILGDDVSGEFLTDEGTIEEEKIAENANQNKSTEKNVKTTTEISQIQEKTTNTASTKQLNSKSPYYIKVNNLQNVVNIYEKDESGEYTKPIKAMICSTGISTPKAGSKYKITTYRRTWNGLKGNVYGQYATQIVGNILFHSVPYTAKRNDSLEYWEYDKLGTSASLGCIRLTVEDAKWIYDFIPSGTIVEFYEDENPGPFGKPIAMKISDNELNRNWDPTDTAFGNPWNTSSTTQPVISGDIGLNSHLEISTNSGEIQDNLSIDISGSNFENIVIIKNESGNSMGEDVAEIVITEEQKSEDEITSGDNINEQNNEKNILIEENQVPEFEELIFT